MQRRSSQLLTQLMQLRKESLKKSGLPGFEPWPLRYRCSALTTGNQSVIWECVWSWNSIENNRRFSAENTLKSKESLKNLFKKQAENRPKRPPEARKSDKSTGNTQQVRFFKLYFDFNVFSAENRRLFSIEFQLHTNSHIMLWLPVL